MNVLIGGAWPYANGSLHIGHIAALLPGDILARYHRAKGDNVYFVSGSDCHGTPVTIRAKKENKTPYQVSEYYHSEFEECFKELGFSYDYYGKTSTDEHKDFVVEFHKKLYKSQYVYKKIAPQAFCNGCNQFLGDRFVVGNCPNCGGDARGDQCEVCGHVLEAENLLSPFCSICGCEPVFKDSEHLYIALSKLEEILSEYIESHKNWRNNALQFSRRYIKEGLKDRAITRDLDWGIDVPCEGYEGKKIYIWAENVLGYITSSYVASKDREDNFNAIWGKDSRHYYVHGKDNIPFHTIILPALLHANGEGWHLPDEIISSEYLTLEGKKISTSQNWAIWVRDIVKKFNKDAIRYFLIANGPEKKDTDFSYREFVNSNNGELLGAYGNFVNRSLVFVEKYFNGKVPDGVFSNDVKEKIELLYINVGLKIEEGEFKSALEEIFEFIRFSNKYYDQQKPWSTRIISIDECRNTIFNCVQIIVNLAILLSPFLPFSSEKILSWLGCNNEWEVHYVDCGYSISKSSILFERIDKRVIDEELLGLRN